MFSRARDADTRCGYATRHVYRRPLDTVLTYRNISADYALICYRGLMDSIYKLNR